MSLSPARQRIADGLAADARRAADRERLDAALERIDEDLRAAYSAHDEAERARDAARTPSPAALADTYAHGETVTLDRTDHDAALKRAADRVAELRAARDELRERRRRVEPHAANVITMQRQGAFDVIEEAGLNDALEREITRALRFVRDLHEIADRVRPHGRSLQNLTYWETRDEPSHPSVVAWREAIQRLENDPAAPAPIVPSLSADKPALATLF